MKVKMHWKSRALVSGVKAPNIPEGKKGMAKVVVEMDVPVTIFNKGGEKQVWLNFGNQEIPGENVNFYLADNVPKKKVTPEDIEILFREVEEAEEETEKEEAVL